MTPRPARAADGAARDVGETATRRRRLLAVVACAVVVVYAGLSTYLTSRNPGWYAALEEPAFQPPDLVFAGIWPLNFLALAAVGAAYCLREPPHQGRAFVALLAVSVTFSLGWAFLFYLPHLLFPAAFSLLLGALLTWLLVAAAAASSRWLGAALVVYAAWLSLATALAFTYAGLN